MVDKIDEILLPSVSSVYSFFFYCALWFFFRLDLKKNCSFKSSFVDFFFVNLQVFVYFSLMRGILMIQSYLLMFFRFFIWGVDFWNFPLFISSNDVRWGRNWGWIFVRDVDVRDNLRAMCRIISWNIWKCLFHLFCNSSYHFLKLMFEFLMNNFSCFCFGDFWNDDFVSDWCNGFFRYSWFVTSVNVFAVFVTLFDVYL